LEKCVTAYDATGIFDRIERFGTQRPARLDQGGYDRRDRRESLPGQDDWRDIANRPVNWRVAVQERSLEHLLSFLDVVVAGLEEALGEVVIGLLPGGGSIDGGANDVDDGDSGRVGSI
jgi:hypothetical protein